MLAHNNITGWRRPRCRWLKPDTDLSPSQFVNTGRRGIAALDACSWWRTASAWSSSWCSARLDLFTIPDAGADGLSDGCSFISSSTLCDPSFGSVALPLIVLLSSQQQPAIECCACRPLLMTAPFESDNCPLFRSLSNLSLSLPWEYPAAIDDDLRSLFDFIITFLSSSLSSSSDEMKIGFVIMISCVQQYNKNPRYNPCWRSSAAAAAPFWIWILCDNYNALSKTLIDSRGSGFFHYFKSFENI